MKKHKAVLSLFLTTAAFASDTVEVDRTRYESLLRQVEYQRDYDLLKIFVIYSIHKAIADRDVEVLREISNVTGRDISQSCSDQDFLVRAIEMDWSEGLEVFLLCGFDPEARDVHRGKNPLAEAARRGSCELVACLLDEFAKVNPAAVCAAASSGNVDILQLFIEEGANVNCYFEGRTPLLLAIKENHKKMVQLLIEHGAKVTPEGVDSWVKYPLNEAAHEGFYEIEEILIEAGAKKHPRNAFYRKKLHVSPGESPYERID